MNKKTIVSLKNLFAEANVSYKDIDAMLLLKEEETAPEPKNNNDDTKGPVEPVDPSAESSKYVHKDKQYWDKKDGSKLFWDFYGMFTLWTSVGRGNEVWYGPSPNIYEPVAWGFARSIRKSGYDKLNKIPSNKQQDIIDKVFHDVLKQTALELVYYLKRASLLELQHFSSHSEFGKLPNKLSSAINAGGFNWDKFIKCCKETFPKADPELLYKVLLFTRYYNSANLSTKVYTEVVKAREDYIKTKTDQETKSKAIQAAIDADKEIKDKEVQAWLDDPNIDHDAGLYDIEKEPKTTEPEEPSDVEPAPFEDDPESPMVPTPKKDPSYMSSDDYWNPEPGSFEKDPGSKKYLFHKKNKSKLTEVGVKGGQQSEKVASRGGLQTIKRVHDALKKAGISLAEVREMYYNDIWGPDEQSKSYGGPAWGDGMAAAVKLEKIMRSSEGAWNHKTMMAMALEIDHIYDLNHNTGSLLNKGKVDVSGSDLDGRAKMKSIARFIPKVSPRIQKILRLYTPFVVDKSDVDLNDIIASPTVAFSPKEDKFLREKMNCRDIDTGEPGALQRNYKWMKSLWKGPVEQKEQRSTSVYFKRHINGYYTISDSLGAEGAKFTTFKDLLKYTLKEYKDYFSFSKNTQNLSDYQSSHTKIKLSPTQEEELKKLQFGWRNNSKRYRAEANDGNNFYLEAYSDGSFAIYRKHGMGDFKKLKKFEDAITTLKTMTSNQVKPLVPQVVPVAAPSAPTSQTGFIHSDIQIQPDMVAVKGALKTYISDNTSLYCISTVDKTYQATIGNKILFNISPNTSDAGYTISSYINPVTNKMESELKKVKFKTITSALVWISNNANELKKIGSGSSTGPTASVTPSAFGSNEPKLPPHSTSIGAYTMHSGMNTTPSPIRLVKMDEDKIVAHGFKPKLDIYNKVIYFGPAADASIKFYPNNTAVLVTGGNPHKHFSSIYSAILYIQSNYPKVSSITASTGTNIEKGVTSKFAEKELASAGFTWDNQAGQYKNEGNIIIVSPSFQSKIVFADGTKKDIGGSIQLKKYLTSEYQADKISHKAPEQSSPASSDLPPKSLDTDNLSEEEVSYAKKIINEHPTLEASVVTNSGSHKVAAIHIKHASTEIGGGTTLYVLTKKTALYNIYKAPNFNTNPLYSTLTFELIMEHLKSLLDGGPLAAPFPEQSEEPDNFTNEEFQYVKDVVKKYPNLNAAYNNSGDGSVVIWKNFESTLYSLLKKNGLYRIYKATNFENPLYTCYTFYAMITTVRAFLDGEFDGGGGEPTSPTDAPTTPGGEYSKIMEGLKSIGISDPYTWNPNSLDDDAEHFSSQATKWFRNYFENKIGANVDEDTTENECKWIVEHLPETLDAIKKYGINKLIGDGYDKEGFGTKVLKASSNVSHITSLKKASTPDIYPQLIDYVANEVKMSQSELEAIKPDDFNKKNPETGFSNKIEVIKAVRKFYSTQGLLTGLGNTKKMVEKWPEFLAYVKKHGLPDLNYDIHVGYDFFEKNAAAQAQETSQSSQELKPSGETYKTHDGSVNYFPELIKLNEQDEKIVVSAGFKPFHNYYRDDYTQNAFGFYNDGTASYVDPYGNVKKPFNTIPEALQYIIDEYINKKTKTTPPAQASQEPTIGGHDANKLSYVENEIITKAIKKGFPDAEITNDSNGNVVIKIDKNKKLQEDTNNSDKYTITISKIYGKYILVHKTPDGELNIPYKTYYNTMKDLVSLIALDISSSIIKDYSKLVPSGNTYKTGTGDKIKLNSYDNQVLSICGFIWDESKDAYVSDDGNMWVAFLDNGEAYFYNANSHPVVSSIPTMLHEIINGYTAKEEKENPEQSTKSPDAETSDKGLSELKIYVINGLYDAELITTTNPNTNVIQSIETKMNVPGQDEINKRIISLIRDFFKKEMGFPISFKESGFIVKKWDLFEKFVSKHGLPLEDDFEPKDEQPTWYWKIKSNDPMVASGEYAPATDNTDEMPFSGYDYAHAYEVLHMEPNQTIQLIVSDNKVMEELGFGLEYSPGLGNFYKKEGEKMLFYADGSAKYYPSLDDASDYTVKHFDTVKEAMQFLWDKHKNKTSSNEPSNTDAFPESKYKNLIDESYVDYLKELVKKYPGYGIMSAPTSGDVAYVYITKSNPGVSSKVLFSIYKVDGKFILTDDQTETQLIKSDTFSEMVAKLQSYIIKDTKTSDELQIPTQGVMSGLSSEEVTFLEEFSKKYPGYEAIEPETSKNNNKYKTILISYNHKFLYAIYKTLDKYHLSKYINSKFELEDVLTSSSFKDIVDKLKNIFSNEGGNGGGTLPEAPTPEQPSPKKKTSKMPYSGTEYSVYTSEYFMSPDQPIALIDDDENTLKNIGITAESDADGNTYYKKGNDRMTFYANGTAMYWPEGNLNQKFTTVKAAMQFLWDKHSGNIQETMSYKDYMKKLLR